MVEALGRIGFGLFGLAVLIGIAWLFSNNRRAVDWRLVVTGILLQIGFGERVLFQPRGWQGQAQALPGSGQAHGGQGLGATGAAEQYG